MKTSPFLRAKERRRRRQRPRPPPRRRPRCRSRWRRRWRRLPTPRLPQSSRASSNSYSSSIGKNSRCASFSSSRNSSAKSCCDSRRFNGFRPSTIWRWRRYGVKASPSTPLYPTPRRYATSTRTLVHGPTPTRQTSRAHVLAYTLAHARPLASARARPRSFAPTCTHSYPLARAFARWCPPTSHARRSPFVVRFRGVFAIGRHRQCNTSPNKVWSSDEHV